MKILKIITPFLFFFALIGCIVLFRAWKNSEEEYSQLRTSYQEVLKQNINTTIPIEKIVRDTILNESTHRYNPIVTSESVTTYVSKSTADSMALALNVATKEITRLKSVVINLKGEGKGVRVSDTINKISWLILKNDPTFDVKVNLSNDSIFPSVRLRLMQAYAPYRRSIFSTTEYRSVIKASDSRVQLSEVIDVNKAPRSPRWALGLFGGGIYTPKGLYYGVGLGLSYDLIQF